MATAAHFILVQKIHWGQAAFYFRFIFFFLFVTAVAEEEESNKLEVIQERTHKGLILKSTISCSIWKHLAIMQVS